MIGIYKIFNKTKPEKVYIGQSVNILNRKSQHFHKLRSGKRSNSYLQNVFNKYGEESIKFEIVLECDKEELNEKEILVIKQYNSFLNGYNLTEGGDNAEKTPQTCAKISKSHIGKKLSEYHIEQIKKSKIGLKVYGMCVAQYTMSMELVNVYESVNKVAENVKVSASYLGRILKKKDTSKGGFIWKYITREDYHILESQTKVEEINNIYTSSNQGIIVKIGEKEMYYPTIKECSKSLKIDQTTIIRSLKGEVKNNRKGYEFKYYNLIKK